MATMRYATRSQTRRPQCQPRATRSHTRRSQPPHSDHWRVQRPSSNKRPAQSLPANRQPVVQPSKKRRTEREEEEEMELDEERARDLDQTAHAFVQRARLFRIDATIQQLERERGSLTAQLDLRKYTVLTLPSEIVSEIFLHALDPRSLNTRSPAPTVLAQVCGHWREIALSLPALWSTLSLKLNRATVTNRLAMANTWLTRSGARPLSISLRYGPEFGGITHLGAEFLQFIDEISSAFFRLEHLDVGVHLSGASLKLLQYPMPKLKHLTLWMDRLHTEDDVPLVMSPEAVPLLRSLEIRHYHPFGTLVLPWKQLTTLKCNYIEYRHLKKILEQTSALSHCMIDDMLRGPTSDKTSITLPHLESLVFSLYAPDENPIHHIFPISMMELPALRILEIPETYLRHPSCDDLRVLVDSWGCSLQELRIIDLAQTSERTYIEKFPSIPSISFHRQVPRAIVGREDDEDKQAQAAGGGVRQRVSFVLCI
ncbi:hypothetical protein B0H17DRAFT_1131104 [Mycena rosella]|uniref:F-box domain-containing protein n=1 Tax=Mycena rosella TaxID=1033263 RepID=A0AAD7D4R3_MYCRO|nr:hypothetical protein B0H17DRAFT_1139197 [Mycena rosella]KAJ7696328.1 hypothetical protein B0H17DRAFT_1131104 [Mycena rosella]